MSELLQQAIFPLIDRSLYTPSSNITQSFVANLDLPRRYILTLWLQLLWNNIAVIFLGGLVIYSRAGLFRGQSALGVYITTSAVCKREKPLDCEPIRYI